MEIKNRAQILKLMVSKLHQLMDDIVDLTMRIAATEPGLYMHLDETPLSVPRNSMLDEKGLEDYRNTLREQLKELSIRKSEDPTYDCLVS